jgi:hypothetical protein
MAATVDQGRSRDVLPGGDVLAHHTYVREDEPIHAI